MTSNTTAPHLIHDLYPGLGRKQRAYLADEQRPSRREAAELSPFPLLPEMAAAVEALQRRYVLPWPLLCDYHLGQWLHDSFAACGARDIPLICSVDLWDTMGVFRHIADARKHWAGTDYQHGLTDITDAFYEKALGKLEALVAGFALEEPIKASTAVYMPSFPFGPSALRYIPLERTQWIDVEVLALCEAGALLEAEGMLRLPPADPSPLAWDRFLAPDTDWSAPRPARPEVLTVAVDQARANLSRCPGEPRIIGGRPHILIDRYAHWPGRHVRGPLDAVRVEGLVVTKWNRWIDEESDCGWLEVDGGHLIAEIKHPCPLVPGQDYEVVGGPRAVRDALQQRAAALAALSD